MLQRALWRVGKAVAINLIIDQLGLSEFLDSGSGDEDESGTGTDSTTTDSTTTDSTGTDNLNVFYGDVS